MKQRTPLREQDPYGRVDVALHRLGEKIAEHVGGEKGKRIWNGGLGEVAERVLENAGLQKVVTPVGVAEEMGLIPRRKRIR